MGFSIKLKYKTYFYLFYFQLYYYITDVNIMCYNSTESLNVFVVMVISTIYLFYRNYSNDKFFATGHRLGSGTIRAGRAHGRRAFLGRP